VNTPDQVRTAAAVPAFSLDVPGSRRPAGPARRRRRLVRGLVALAVAGVSATGWFASRLLPWQRADASRELPRQLVSRVDLSSRLTASGRVESSRKTIIQCELERLELRSEGRTVASGGASIILEVVEEGTKVKKGDVLCRLDSSDYEELVRTQQMKTEQSRAALEQARLNFDVAELAVGEYRDGLVRQTVQQMEGEITLAESDLERASDRLQWTAKMLVKGYVPVVQKSTAERALAQIRLRLLTSRWDLANFREFGNPKTMKELLSEVEKRRFEVIANTQRVTRFDERLAYYRKMVDRCTIRAPHDGFLIYAVDPSRRNAPRLEPGVEVRQQQQLFYLPDLAQMEIVTYLHESVASRVHDGLPARAKIEGLENRTLEGHVVSLGPLPVNSPVWTVSEEVKFFIAVVRLDTVPEGLLPGMTAEVEIDIDRSHDVLAIPAESVAYEHGHDICYVAGVDGLERRQITLGRSNHALLEVTRGLVEGEAVIMNPADVESIDSLVVHSDREPEGVETGPDGAPAATSASASASITVE